MKGICIWNDMVQTSVVGQEFDWLLGIYRVLHQVYTHTHRHTHIDDCCVLWF
jgi:hypothetical protein